jgi:hypothetical protein
LGRYVDEMIILPCFPGTPYSIVYCAHGYLVFIVANSELSAIVSGVSEDDQITVKPRAINCPVIYHGMKHSRYNQRVHITVKFFSSYK